MTPELPAAALRGPFLSRRLRRWLLPLGAAALWLQGCATPTPPEPLLQRAVGALGGPALQAWRTLRVEGTVRFYDPEQSPVPGGEPRFGAEAQFVQWRDLGTDRSRTEWRTLALRPVERRMTYTEVLDGTTGSVKGMDSMLPVRPTATSGEHLMSAMRVASTRRDQLLTSPRLLLQALQQPAALRAADDLVVDGRRLPSARWASPFGDLRLAFDPATGLPERLRLIDYDPIQADSDFDLVLGDWRRVGGVLYPFSQRYTLNGKQVADTTIAVVEPDAALPPQAFAVAAAAAPVVAKAAPEGQHQWTFRKQGFGVLVDADEVVWDPAVASGMTLTPMGPSVWLVSGGFYNSLLVELEDSLVVYDAPHEVSSQWILRETKARFPHKPIKHVVLTHAHMDHAGGLRSYAAQGATLVVGKPGVAAHLREALKRPTTQGIPELRGPEVARALAATRIVEIDGPWSMGQGAVKAQAYPVEANGHADGMLFGYVPGAKLGFVSDLWSPGRGPLPAAGTETHGFLLALVRSVEAWKLDPERFAGGHGSFGDYAPARRLLLPAPAAGGPASR